MLRPPFPLQTALLSTALRTTTNRRRTVIHRAMEAWWCRRITRNSPSQRGHGARQQLGFALARPDVFPLGREHVREPPLPAHLGRARVKPMPWLALPPSPAGAPNIPTPYEQ
jgi:hypothetical protein